MDVVIPMQQSSDYILLFPQEIDWEKFTQYHPDEPFSDGVIEFLNALSSVLLKIIEVVCFRMSLLLHFSVEGQI